MRAATPLLAALSLLAACQSWDSVLTTSYRIHDDDLTIAEANALAYCVNYGMEPKLQDVETSPSGNIAVYRCGPVVKNILPPAPAPGTFIPKPPLPGSPSGR